MRLTNNKLKDEEFYEGMGVYFVALATDLGYGTMLQVQCVISVLQGVVDIAVRDYIIQ